MSVSIDYARNMVANESRYKDSPAWRDKVYRMKPDQVLAVYHNMLNKGEFNKKAKKVEELTEKPTFTQPTLFDFGLQLDKE